MEEIYITTADIAGAFLKAEYIGFVFVRLHGPIVDA